MLNFLSFEVLPPDGQRPCQGGIQIANELSFVCGGIYNGEEQFSKVNFYFGVHVSKKDIKNIKSSLDSIRQVSCVKTIQKYAMRILYCFQTYFLTKIL